ncbi:hypothetical protein XELAEV_18010378mg [Xenopus laevis]|uniref:Uncharacterized protein n=1 Tax=Xenopus laevis TaxID=8355 RepID=A0A974I1P0_XENLA|nr:hypothetical protein XELAEV_18010378mg [Xenopus laevis]
MLPHNTSLLRAVHGRSLIREQPTPLPHTTLWGSVFVQLYRHAHEMPLTIVRIQRESNREHGKGPGQF